MSTVPQVKTIALLVCGGLAPNVEVLGLNNPILFQRLLDESLPAPGSAKAVIHPYDVVKMKYPPEEKLHQYDAMIITGSAASAYENVEWINKLICYVAHVADNWPEIKIFGSCFGHQIVGRAFGSPCVPNNGRWEMGPTPLNLTGLGKAVFGVETFNIESVHQDHVPTVPLGLHLLGSTGVSANQGMVKFRPGVASPEEWTKMEDVQILTVQGHPEYTEEIARLTIAFFAEEGVIDMETLEDVERRRYWRQDGVRVGKAMWGMLGVS